MTGEESALRIGKPGRDQISDFITWANINSRAPTVNLGGSTHRASNTSLFLKRTKLFDSPVLAENDDLDVIDTLEELTTVRKKNRRTSRGR